MRTGGKWWRGGGTEGLIETRCAAGLPQEGHSGGDLTWLLAPGHFWWAPCKKSRRSQEGWPRREPSPEHAEPHQACRKRNLILLPVISSIQLTFKNNRPCLAFYKRAGPLVGSQDFELVPIKFFAIGRHSISQASPHHFADKWKCVWRLLSCFSGLVISSPRVCHCTPGTY